MSQASARADLRAAVTTLSAAMSAAAAQWRLVFLWLAGLLVPTAIVSMPVWYALGRLDWSPRAEALARHFDALYLGDVVNEWVRHTFPPLNGAVWLGLIVSWLLAPFLAGATLTVAREPEQPVGFTALIQGGVGWYARQLKLQLVALLSLGTAGGVGAAALWVAHERGARATLESQANASFRGSLFVAVLVYALAHAALEAARAGMAADERHASPWRAWAGGLRVLIERPLTVLALYLVPTTLGGLVAAIAALVRIRIAGATTVGFAVAWMVAQLAVAAIGWGRAGRLIALTALAAHRRTRVS